MMSEDLQMNLNHTLLQMIWAILKAVKNLMKNIPKWLQMNI